MNTWCKYSIFFILLFSLQSFGKEAPYIISGFDDVLRQANNTNLFNVAVKIFEKDKTYAGMSKLYELISKNEKLPKFSLVSAISLSFESRINEFLKESLYPPHERHLRSWLTEWSIEKFKVRKIKEIIDSHPKRKFIIIFDNSDTSIALSKRIQKEFSKKIESIYLREVVNKELPEGVTPFFTAFDIALHEFTSKRMNSKELKLVGQEVLKESKLEKVLPSYGVCPESYNPCEGTQSDIGNICLKVRNHIRKLCAR